MIKLTTLITFILFYTNVILHAQSSEKLKSQELFSLGEQSYDLGTFEYYFLKNSDRPNQDSAKIKTDEYLDLYVHFRLKVQEAIDRGMHKEQAFIDELEGYKKQLAEPYLTTTKFNQKLLTEAYDRMKYEVSAAHILLRLEEDALPEDTLRVHQELNSLKEKIQSGSDFEEMAKAHSQDPSAQQNGGDLGYFSALQMVYPFENAAFDNPVGSVVGPIRTRFGYHLLKIKDRRPARGQIKVAHIMIRTNQDTSSHEKAEKKINSIYDNLQNGKDWKEQCDLYSEDQSSAKNGGELRWFGTGALVPSFENAAFALNTTGQISEPVKTRFGWHIIKLVDKKSIQPFDEVKSDLENKIKRDSRSKNSKKTVLEILKKEQNFELNEMAKSQALQYIDSTLLLGKWSFSDTSLNQDQIIFGFDEAAFSVKQFYEYVQEKQRPKKNANLNDYKNQLYNRFETESVFNAELELIEKNNQDYKRILDEYRSGILLFNLMEEEVWQKALKDSVGLDNYYANHSDQYLEEEMLEVRKITSADQTIIDSLKTLLHFSNSQLDSLFNNQEALTLQIEDLKVKKGEIEFIDNHWQVGTHIQETGEYHTLWEIKKKLTQHVPPLNEIKGLVISDYQNELESIWLDSLKKKYPYKLNKKALKNFVKTF